MKNSQLNIVYCILFGSGILITVIGFYSAIMYETDTVWFGFIGSGLVFSSAGVMMIKDGREKKEKKI